jgi:hypothetical protein
MFHQEIPIISAIPPFFNKLSYTDRSIEVILSSPHPPNGYRSNCTYADNVHLISASLPPAVIPEGAPALYESRYDNSKVDKHSLGV